jgi:hypothetical protein
MFTQDQIEQATQQLNDFVAEHVEYNETHVDSLNDLFACLIDGMDTQEAENRLKDFCKENEIDLSGVEIDTLLDDLLEVATPSQEHVFSFDRDKFSVLSCLWGEHEICLDHIEREMGAELFAAIPENDVDAFLDGNRTRAYVTSDAVASLSVTVEQIRAAIAQEKE